MEKLSFMYDMIESELRDAVGYDNVGTDPDELLSYGTDYYWIARMWMDKGQEPPKGRFLVRRNSRIPMSFVTFRVTDLKESTIRTLLESAESAFRYSTRGGSISGEYPSYTPTTSLPGSAVPSVPSSIPSK